MTSTRSSLIGVTDVHSGVMSWPTIFPSLFLRLPQIRPSSNAYASSSTLPRDKHVRTLWSLTSLPERCDAARHSRTARGGCTFVLSISGSICFDIAALPRSAGHAMWVSCHLSCDVCVTPVCQTLCLDPCAAGFRWEVHTYRSVQLLRITHEDQNLVAGGCFVLWIRCQVTLSVEIICIC